MIKVIVGTMFAGKSTALREQGLKLREEGKRVLFVKPDMDNRYAEDLIVTHDGKSVRAVQIDVNDPTFLEWISSDFDVICIDEIQFFNVLIIPLIKKISGLNKQVIVSGLDLTFSEKPFATTDLLLGQADEVERLHAECTGCGEPSYISARLEGFSDAEVVLGSEDLYQPLCKSCYEKTKTGGN
ncbi:thymidine kinase [Priestia megaterium]